MVSVLQYVLLIVNVILFPLKISTHNQAAVVYKYQINSNEIQQHTLNTFQ